MRSQMRDQAIFTPSLDTENIRKLTESNLSQSFHHHKPYHDGNNSVRVSAASKLQANKSTKEHTPHNLHMQILVDDAKRRHFLSHNPLDCDHKLLSSSPQAQTSMHSQVRRRARSSKGRLHVSFSEDSPSDFPHSEKERGRKLDLLDFGRGVSPTRRLNLNDTGKLNSHELARDLKLGSYECQCLASSTAHKELLKRLADDRKTADSGRNYSSKDAKEALAATWSSCGDFQGQYLQTGSDPESSLKHSSDAKLNSCFCPLSNSTFTSLGDFQSKCRSLLDEKPLEDSQPVSAPLSVARKGQESSVSLSLSPSRVEFKHSRSPTHCSKETNKEHQLSDQKSGHIWTENPHDADKSSPVVVLLQLLQLVDRYWNGSGSLLLNNNFLAAARDLLRNLMAAAPSQQESQVASFKELSGEASAAMNYSSQGKHSLSYDELLSRNKQLSAKVDALTSELKQFKNQQDTINLLRESQKSLVSTNNLLMQQLNREQGPSSAKGALLSEKITASTKAPFLVRTSRHAPSSSAFDFSQLCSPQQLSSCPF